MGRTVRDYRIETRTARGKLALQKEPYWRLIAEGEHLGFSNRCQRLALHPSA